MQVASIESKVALSGKKDVTAGPREGGDQPAQLKLTVTDKKDIAEGPGGDGDQPVKV